MSKGRVRRRRRFAERTMIDLAGLDHRQARRVMRRNAGSFFFYDEFFMHYGIDPVIHKMFEGVFGGEHEQAQDLVRHGREGSNPSA